jgi:hypothetical protein
MNLSHRATTMATIMSREQKSNDLYARQSGAALVHIVDVKWNE